MTRLKPILVIIGAAAFVACGGATDNDPSRASTTDSGGENAGGGLTGGGSADGITGGLGSTGGSPPGGSSATGGSRGGFGGTTGGLDATGGSAGGSNATGGSSGSGAAGYAGSGTQTTTASETQTGELDCPVPPSVGHVGFMPPPSVSELSATIDVIDPDVVRLNVDDQQVDFDWYGPDANDVLSVGDSVTCTRYAADVVGCGLLDVVRLGGEIVLAAARCESFTLEFPDLSVIGMSLTHAEDCVDGDDHRYRVTFAVDASSSQELRVGDMGSAAGWTGTLVDATQWIPSSNDPESDTESRGVFMMTFVPAAG